MESCTTCRAYVNSIRRLSGLVAGEELAYTAAPAAKKRAMGKTKHIRLWPAVSIAASILLIAGLALYTGYERSSSQQTYINRQSKAEKAEVAPEMVFPAKAVAKLPAGKAVEFKWSRKVEYTLVIRHGGRTIVEAKGNGSSYRMKAALTEGLPALEWTLSAGGKQLKGIIYFTK